MSTTLFDVQQFVMSLVHDLEEDASVVREVGNVVKVKCVQPLTINKMAIVARLMHEKFGGAIVYSWMGSSELWIGLTDVPVGTAPIYSQVADKISQMCWQVANIDLEGESDIDVSFLEAQNEELWDAYETILDKHFDGQVTISHRTDTLMHVWITHKNLEDIIP